ncbi:hypothetical protein [Flavihumibacter sp. UBA7668]|uniref:hypothetical protein n=1 Tax=Flavihumibacter sp. UBA7668 TaxID=1946542 RepID=UPI0025B8E2C5|nr:hypothetical protein [Flavihumibacter sp. UBA7668]
MKTFLFVLSATLMNGILFAQSNSSKPGLASKTEIMAQGTTELSAEPTMEKVRILKNSTEKKASAAISSNIETASAVSTKVQGESRKTVKATRQQLAKMQPSLRIQPSANVQSSVKVMSPSVQVKTKVNTGAGIRLH